MVSGNICSQVLKFTAARETAILGFGRSMSWPSAGNITADLASRGDKHREVTSQVSSRKVRLLARAEGTKLPTLSGENRGDPTPTSKGPMAAARRARGTTAFNPQHINPGSPNPGPQSLLPC